jgi:hypothetical protein
MTAGEDECFEYGAVTRYGRPFQNRSSTLPLYSVIHLMLDLLVPQHRASNAIRLDTGTV